MTRRKNTLFVLFALLLPMAVHGQCDPLPLPYTTDLRTGFHTEWHTTSMGYSFTTWEVGLNHDNCWTGYIERSSNDAGAGDAAGFFGFVAQYPNGSPDTNYTQIGVGDSLNDGLAMLIAPEFEQQPASIELSMVLQKHQRFGQPVCTNYYAFVDVGWVRDISCPNESFMQTGTMCVWTYPGIYLEWRDYCLPVHDSIPDGYRFALRMRTELQAWPHPNGCYDIIGFLYELKIKRFEASTQVCNPATMTDTVYLTDTVCQHTPYSGNGLIITAQQTADTGLHSFTQHDYEYLPDGNCVLHVRVLTLRVLPSDISIAVDSIFPGDAYLFAGRELTLAGGYVDDHGLNAYGCPIKDSLELSIRPLPPIACDAEIGVERLEWYISQPTEVNLWAETEADSYRWSPAELFADDTARNVSFMLQPESEQWVHLEAERFDSLNHIYRGAEMDTTAQLLQLTVPVEPQTRYRLVATLGDGNPLPVQVTVDNTVLLDNTLTDGRLLLELNTYQNRQITFSIVTQQPVRMANFSLCRYCHAEDSVLIMAHSARPAIEADRTRICLGDSVSLRSGQTDYYRWVSQPVDTALDAFQGFPSLTVSPQTTTTYYLLTRGGEVADSVVIVVQAYPELRVVADCESVDFDNPVLTLEELSEVTSVRWTFSDGGEIMGRKVRWHFDEVFGDSLWVREIGCTANGCCTDTLLLFPVEIVSVWFPNVFTPDAETNNRFAMITNQMVEEYEMNIYNREGLLVARYADVVAGWDGRDSRGMPCQQGAYAYVCKYRLAGKDVKRYVGTVLLLR